MNKLQFVAVIAIMALSSSGALAQGRGGRGGPAVVSPEVSADGHVTFRVLAPDATKVKLFGAAGARRVECGSCRVGCPYGNIEWKLPRNAPPRVRNLARLAGFEPAT